MRAKLAMIAVLALCFSGCRAPLPPIYPTFSTPEETWMTYKRAWRLGDVGVLQDIYGGVLAVELRRQIEVNGVEATREYYRGDFAAARFGEPDFYEKSSKLAYLRVTITDARGRSLTLRYSIVRFASMWKIVNFVKEEWG